MEQDLFTTFQARALDAPDTPFLILPDLSTITYGAALARCGQMAGLFRAAGVQPGDRLAVQVEKSPTALLTYLAAQAIGAVYLPLNTAYTAAEVRYFLADARPALFIHRPQDDAAMAALCAEIGVPARLTLGADEQGTLAAGLKDYAPDLAPYAASPGDLAAILYTSGTTGRSKGAMLTRANLASNAFTLKDYWRFSQSDVLLHALPIFHTHGLFVATNITIAAGSAMILCPRFDVAELIRLMPRASVLMGVPTFYSRLLAEPAFTRDLVAHMRLFVSGSAPLSAETHKEFSARTGHAILERYGMTETNMNTSNPYDGPRIPGSVGLPLPGVELRITDPETGAVLPLGAVGGIEVRGPNVFKGYWQMPEKTAEELRPDGFFITGDMGVIDPAGYVAIVGRAKDLIICGGFNVYPAEVEALIDAIPGIAESAVIGVPHPDMGEGVVAVVQARDAALDEAAVLGALQGQLARFKQPRRVVFVPELPRNTMGKIQKKALRETYATLFAAKVN
ncbi:malonyl-CoA/methylmalonyl-CoA synthetase [Novosphingobium capsulatum]|uniref:Malonyl-CoA/methylmalonyl-CoA synthetase n=1 Tax=Novosphingobium capsulatum TaxID=13688 RepID=A0ABU1ML29_9SPHN|nr:malonyl-CoA synthase [Novosphingobium capsulatum]MDR6511031.1 malonyl-CoA/methylmalonyl-CoA synthetase [Novosphingobium capsulatum]